MKSDPENHNLTLIKDFFVVAESSYSMFWEIVLGTPELQTKISGDAGGFSIDIIIGDTEFPLWQYDRKVIDLAKTTNENIRQQLNILNKLIEQLGNKESDAV